MYININILKPVRRGLRNAATLILNCQKEERKTDIIRLPVEVAATFIILTWALEIYTFHISCGPADRDSGTELHLSIP